MDVQALKLQANDALLDEDYDLALDLFDKVNPCLTDSQTVDCLRIKFRLSSC